jgi:hypothetical protein
MVCCLCVLLLGVAGGPAYESKQGRVILQMEAKEKAGRVEIPLSGTTITLSVSGGPDLQVTMPQPLVQPKSWLVRPLPARGPAEKGRWQQRFHIEPPDKKNETLTLEISLLAAGPNEQPQRVQWQIPVRVTTEIKSASLTELRGPTDPEPVPPAASWWPVVSALLAAFVLSALGLVAWELLGRRLKRKAVLTPNAWAVHELDRLRGLDLSAEDNVQRFPTLLSDVIRRYFELRFRLHAPQQTTAEFLAAMQESPQLAAEQQTLLREFLERCDLAKFAQAFLSADECQALVGKARALVEQTADVQETPV